MLKNSIQKIVIIFFLFLSFFVINDKSYAEYYNFNGLNLDACSWNQWMNRGSNSCSWNILYANYIDWWHTRYKSYNLSTNQPINSFDVSFHSTIQRSSSGRWANAWIMLGPTNANGDDPIIALRATIQQVSGMSYSWYLWYTYKDFLERYGRVFKGYYWPAECNTVWCPYLEVSFKTKDWKLNYYIFNAGARDETAPSRLFRVILSNWELQVFIDGVLKHKIQIDDLDLMVQQSDFKVLAGAFTTNNGDFGGMRLSLADPGDMKPIKIGFWKWKSEEEEKWPWENVAPEAHDWHFWYRYKDNTVYYVDNHKIIWPYLKTWDTDKDFLNLWFISYPVGLKGLNFNFTENKLKEGEKIYLLGIKRDDSIVNLQTIDKNTWSINHYVTNNDIKMVSLWFSKTFNRFWWSINFSAFEDRSTPYFYDREPLVKIDLRDKETAYWTKTLKTKKTFADIYNPVKIDFPWHNQDRTIIYDAPWWIKKASISWNTESCCDRVRATFYNEEGNEISVNPNNSSGNGSVEVDFTANQKIKKIKLRYTTDSSSAYWPILVNKLTFHETEIEEEVPFTFKDYDSQKLGRKKAIPTEANPYQMNFPWHNQDRREIHQLKWYAKKINFDWNVESCNDRAYIYYYREDWTLYTTNPDAGCYSWSSTIDIPENEKVNKIEFRYTTDGSTYYWPIRITSIEYHPIELPGYTYKKSGSFDPKKKKQLIPIEVNPYQMNFPWHNQDKRETHQLKWYAKEIKFDWNVDTCSDRAYINYYREDWTLYTTNPNAGCYTWSSSISIPENEKVNKIEIRYTTNSYGTGWPIRITSIEYYSKEVEKDKFENIGFSEYEKKIKDVDNVFSMTNFSIKKQDNKLFYYGDWDFNNLPSAWVYSKSHYKIVDKKEDCNLLEWYKDKTSFWVNDILTTNKNEKNNTPTDKIWWITTQDYGKYLCLKHDWDLNEYASYKMFSYFPIVKNIRTLTEWQIAERLSTSLHKVIDRKIEEGRITFHYPEMNKIGDTINHWNYYFYVVNNPWECESTFASADKVKNQDLVITKNSQEWRYICLANEANWNTTFKVEPIYFPYLLNVPTVSIEVKQKMWYGTFVSQQIASQIWGDTAWIKENSFELFVSNTNECNLTSYNDKVWWENYAPNNYQEITQTEWSESYKTKAYVKIDEDLLPVNAPLFRIKDESWNGKYLCGRAQWNDWQYWYSQPITLEDIDWTPPTIHFWQLTPSGIATRKTVNLIVYDKSHLKEVKYWFVKDRNDCRFNTDGTDPNNNITWESLPLSQNNIIPIENELYNDTYICVEAQDIHWNKKRNATIEYINGLNNNPPLKPIVNNPYSLITNDNTVRIELNTKDNDINNYKITFTKGVNNQNSGETIEKIIPYQETKVESDWSFTTIININDLEEDDYTFTVKAIDIWGLESPETEWYKFTLKNNSESHPEYTYELTSNTVCSTELYKLLAAKFAKINVNIDNINCLVSTKNNDINFQKIGNYKIKWNVSFTWSKTFTLIEAISQLGKSYPSAIGQPLLDPNKTYLLSIETTFSWTSLWVEPLQTDISLKENWTENAIFTDTYKKDDAKNGLFFHVLNLPIIALDSTDGSQPSITNHEFVYYEKREWKPWLVKFFNINAYKWYTSFAACNGVACEKNYYLQWKGFNDNVSWWIDFRTIQADIFYDKNADKQVQPDKETVASLGYRIPDEKFIITNRIEFPRSWIEIDPTNPNTLMIKAELKWFLNEDNQEFLKNNQFYFVKPNNDSFKEKIDKNKEFIEAYKDCFTFWPNPANTDESQITNFNANNNLCNSKKIFIPATDKNGKKITSITWLQGKNISEVFFEGHDKKITLETNAFANNNIKSLNYTKNLKIHIKNNAFINNPGYNKTSLNKIVIYQPKLFDEAKFIENEDIEHFRIVWFEKIKDVSCFMFDKTEKSITGYIRSEKCTSDVMIPKSIDGIMVEEIANYALQNKWLTSIRFEEWAEIKRIGRNAFSDNNLHSNLLIPKSVKIIDFEAFWWARFNKIYLGENLESIGDYAFGTNWYNAWTWVWEIILPKTLNHIWSRVFWGTQFSNIRVPDEVFVKTGVFFKDGILYRKTSENTAKIEYVGIGDTFNIPDKVEYQGVEYLLNWAWASEFSNWLKTLSAKNVDFDQSWYSQITLNFDPEYSKRTWIYFIDGYLLSLRGGKTYFHLARNFNIEPNKVIQDSYLWKPVKSIGNGAFWWMAVETIRLPNQLQTIEINAFHNNRLSTVELPNSLINLWPFAFRFNYITSMTQHWSNKFPNITNTLYENGNIFVKTPHWYELLYTVNKNNYNVPAKVDNIQVTAIWQQAFSKAQDLPNDFTLPNSINVIWNLAFYQTNIQKITIRDATAELATIPSNPYHTGLEIIGRGSFQGTRIKKFDLWNKITSIYDNAFFGADGDLKLNWKVRWITSKSASSITIWNNTNIEIRSE